jgi:arsenate reductase-like glutaredoxin family protein
MIENKQQTAVDFAVEKLAAFIKGNDLAISLIKNQAKEMEKEQIEDAYSLSRCEWNKIISSSEYYNETYGGGEQ